MLLYKQNISMHPGLPAPHEAFDDPDLIYSHHLPFLVTLPDVPMGSAGPCKVLSWHVMGGFSAESGYAPVGCTAYPETQAQRSARYVRIATAVQSATAQHHPSFITLQGVSLSSDTSLLSSIEQQLGPGYRLARWSDTIIDGGFGCVTFYQVAQFSVDTKKMDDPTCEISSLECFKLENAQGSLIRFLPHMTGTSDDVRVVIANVNATKKNVELAQFHLEQDVFWEYAARAKSHHHYVVIGNYGADIGAPNLGVRNIITTVLPSTAFEEDATQGAGATDGCFYFDSSKPGSGYQQVAIKMIEPSTGTCYTAAALEPLRVTKVLSLAQWRMLTALRPMFSLDANYKSTIAGRTRHYTKLLRQRDSRLLPWISVRVATNLRNERGISISFNDRLLYDYFASAVAPLQLTQAVVEERATYSVSAMQRDVPILENHLEIFFLREEFWRHIKQIGPEVSGIVLQDVEEEELAKWRDKLGRISHSRTWVYILRAGENLGYGFWLAGPLQSGDQIIFDFNKLDSLGHYTFFEWLSIFPYVPEAQRAVMIQRKQQQAVAQLSPADLLLFPHFVALLDSVWSVAIDALDAAPPLPQVSQKALRTIYRLDELILKNIKVNPPGVPTQQDFFEFLLAHPEYLIPIQQAVAALDAVPQEADDHDSTYEESDDGDDEAEDVVLSDDEADIANSELEITLPAPDAQVVVIEVSQDHFDALFPLITDYLAGAMNRSAEAFFAYYAARGLTIAAIKKQVDACLYYLFKQNIQALHRYLSFLPENQMHQVLSNPLMKRIIFFHVDGLFALRKKFPQPSYLTEAYVGFDLLADIRYLKVAHAEEMVFGLNRLPGAQFTTFFAAHRPVLQELFAPLPSMAVLYAKLRHEKLRKWVEQFNFSELAIAEADKDSVLAFLRALPIEYFFAFCLNKRNDLEKHEVWNNLFVSRRDPESASQDLYHVNGNFKLFSQDEFAEYCQENQICLRQFFSPFSYFYELFRALAWRGPSAEPQKQADIDNDQKFRFFIKDTFSFSDLVMEDTDAENVISFLRWCSFDEFVTFLTMQKPSLIRIFSIPANFIKFCQGIRIFSDKFTFFIEHFYDADAMANCENLQELFSVLRSFPATLPKASTEEGCVVRVSSRQAFCTAKKASLQALYQSPEAVRTLYDLEAFKVLYDSSTSKLIRTHEGTYREELLKYHESILEVIEFNQMPQLDVDTVVRLFAVLPVHRVTVFIEQRREDLSQVIGGEQLMQFLKYTPRPLCWGGVPDSSEREEYTSEPFEVWREKRAIFSRMMHVSLLIADKEQMITVLFLLPEDVWPAFFAQRKTELTQWFFTNLQDLIGLMQQLFQARSTQEGEKNNKIMVALLIFMEQHVLALINTSEALGRVLSQLNQRAFSFPEVFKKLAEMLDHNHKLMELLPGLDNKLRVDFFAYVYRTGHSHPLLLKIMQSLEMYRYYRITRGDAGTMQNLSKVLNKLVVQKLRLDDDAYWAIMPAQPARFTLLRQKQAPLFPARIVAMKAIAAQRDTLLFDEFLTQLFVCCKPVVVNSIDDLCATLQQDVPKRTQALSPLSPSDTVVNTGIDVRNVYGMWFG